MHAKSPAFIPAQTRSTFPTAPSTVVARPSVTRPRTPPRCSDLGGKPGTGIGSANVGAGSGDCVGDGGVDWLASFSPRSAASLSPRRHDPAKNMTPMIQGSFDLVTSNSGSLP